MKKVLLGTTALFGAGLLASPALAADGVKLSVGGFFKEAYMVNFDDDSEGEAGNERNTDGFFNDAEIMFSGSTVLDNGLEVGARVELEGETEGDQIDEAWISFSGGFGEIHVGSEDDAMTNGCIVPPGGTANFSAYSPNQWGANTLNSNVVCGGIDGDSQKILYVSPSFGGFQISGSYTPQADETHDDGVGPHTGMPTNEDGEGRHNVSLYATYSYEGDGWGLTWGGGASFEGHVEKTTGPDRDERDLYQTGLNLTFGNFGIGGVFEYRNDAGIPTSTGAVSSNNTDRETDSWSAGVGISYSMDPYTIGLQYGHTDSDIENQGAADSDYDLDRIVLTGNYALGPGIAIDAELGYTWQDVSGPDFDEEQDGNYDAFEIGIGTAITF